MRILVSGASGLIGRSVVESLAREGHVISRLVRSPPARPGDVLWDAPGGRFDAAAAAGAEAVVHLAGENIGSGRWSEEAKRRIRDSRVEGTAFLARSLAALERPPHVMVAASAVGFYGDTGEQEVDESSPAGTGFLADVCRAWEEATAPLAERGVRVVHVRSGVVLARDGGALARMLPLFRLGLGGRVGSGRQWMSWIALEDVERIVSLALRDAALDGAVNAVAPEPVRNADFTRTLASVLGRPAFLPAPAFALRLVLGEMADALLLASSRVVPRRLLERGHGFAHPRLEEALQALLR